jgi:peptidase M28-like protein
MRAADICCTLSRMKFRLPLLLLLSVSAVAQHLVPQQTFDAIASEYSGEAAKEYDRQIIQFHRIQGSQMMADVAGTVVLAKLREWGIESRLEQFPSDGKTQYQSYTSPMAWDIQTGELWVEGVAGDASFVPFRLCRFSDVPMCVSTYSKGGDWTGELVDVGAGTSNGDYQGKDVHGKVALAYGYAADVVRQAAIKHGAIGVVIYPAADDRPDHPDMVRYNGIWTRAGELDKTVGGFQISANQYAKLRELMRKGSVRVHGKIGATLGAGHLTLVQAFIRGKEHPEVEILVTCHLDHPKWSANDNASGSAATMEMARTLHAMISSGKLPAPSVTIHFLWVPEYMGTIAYIDKHPEIRSCGVWDDPRQKPSDKPYKPGEPCIVLNLNLDMVGEDTVKTNSRFYITRTPDSVPGFLNSLMSDVMIQTRESDLYAQTGTRNYWPAGMTPYVQGSDHDLFLGLGIASTMLGHEPDWTHHTSEDTIDKTDASEFRRVGTLASAAAYWAASASKEQWRQLAYRTNADLLADRSRRIGRILADTKSPAGQRRLKVNSDLMNTLAAQQQRDREEFQSGNPPSSPAFDITTLGAVPSPASGTGPRRLSVPPFDKSAFESLAGDDKKWWDDQHARFDVDGPGGGLPSEPTFDLITFEAVNLMDGKRSATDIADVISAEFNRDFDKAWVDRLVGILVKQGLVK